MIGDGVRADEQALGDRAVAAADGHQPQHFEFACTQAVGGGARGGHGAARPQRDAALLLRLLEPYAGRHIVTGTNVVCHGSADRLLGMLWATVGDVQSAERHLQAAIVADAGQGGRPWCAEAQLELAALLLRGHGADRERAKPLLEAALATARELGMASLLQRCVALGARGATPAPCLAPDGLSPRELEVLRLVAVGHSNRAIAERLYISPNTAANHVRNILAKTGCANRTEAAAYASRHGLLLPTGQS